MAQIQMTEALSSALIARLQAEYGTQAISNFALDILLDSANAEIAKLSALNTALQDRVRRAEDLVEDWKRARDPHRAEVMSAADKVKERKGSNVADFNSQ